VGVVGRGENRKSVFEFPIVFLLLELPLVAPHDNESFRVHPTGSSKPDGNPRNLTGNPTQKHVYFAQKVSLFSLIRTYLEVVMSGHSKCWVQKVCSSSILALWHIILTSYLFEILVNDCVLIIPISLNVMIGYFVHSRCLLQSF